MAQIPRVAVGTVQPEADIQPILWALLCVLRDAGIETQTFRSRACFSAHDGPAAITGLATRHLDSWLMTPELCRTLFLRNTQSCDLALVEGHLQPDDHPEQWGGRLETLCDWLQLPTIGVVDVSRLSPCRIPRRPRAEALLLDRVRDAGHAFYWQVALEALWGIPVLGALEDLPGARTTLASLAAGVPPSECLCGAFSRSLSRYLCRRRFLKLAANAPELDGGPRFLESKEKVSTERPTRVAVAFDDCFNCYFPDVFDLLQQRGASLQVFSPLRDESLPPDSDLVLVGCGHPERYAGALSGNTCLAWSIRNHVASGKRIYAEGAGVALLAEELLLADGSCHEMTGLLPVSCGMRPQEAGMSPCEVESPSHNWVAPNGTRMKGYRNHRWSLSRSHLVDSTRMGFDDEMDPCFASTDRVAASLVHLDFAAQPSLLERFLGAA